MPERDDGAPSRETASEDPRRECEVVILHEHERRSSGGRVDNGRRELTIGFPIHGVVVGTEYRLHRNRVAEWPQALIGEDVVVPLVLLVGVCDVSKDISLV